MKFFYTLFAYCILTFLCSSAAQANPLVSDIKAELPKLLGATNEGTEFYFTFHPSYRESNTQGFIKVYVSSNAETAVTLEIPALNYSVTKVTNPYGIIEFQLTTAQAFIHNRNLTEAALPEQVFVGRGIHVSSEEPIICYGMMREQYTSDGFLAIPVAGLGKKYIVSSYSNVPADQWNLNGYTSIVAVDDDTEVNFTMGGNDHSKTAGGLLTGDTRKFIMNEGDVVLIAAGDKYSDITGSVVESNKPVAVVSGHYCAFIPSNIWACDYLIEMDSPVEGWGNMYHVAPIINREKPSIVRILASEDNTLVNRDGAPIGFIKNVGQANGWLEMRAADEVRNSVFSSDKNIAVTQYNPGINDDDAFETDPFQMSILPLGQFYTETTFCTPGNNDANLGFIGNYINIIFQADELGEIPDDLVIATDKNWLGDFTRIKDLEYYNLEAFQYNEGPEKYFSLTLVIDDGVYKLKCNTPFMAYSYGKSWCDTYGYPAGSLFLNKKHGFAPSDMSNPVASYDMKDDGTIDNGMISDRALDGEDEALAMVYFQSAESYNYSFSCADFVPGVDPSVAWEAYVIDPSQKAVAVIVMADKYGNNDVEIITYEPNGFDVEDGNITNDLAICSNPVAQGSRAELLLTLNNDAQCNIQMFDGAGRHVMDIANATLLHGEHSFPLETANLSSGNYIIKAKIAGQLSVHKLIIK